ncbi:MAG TPA: DUF167 family protein [Methanoregulaceae archaeon]|nr:DUF167 family protein [Methanoregulaceae archaeon]
MTDITPALSCSDKGTIITIEVAAASKSSCFPSGFNEWRKAVGCRVRAPAVEGRANREVVTVIAGAIGIEHSRVRIISGSTAPVKKILIEGMTPDQLRSVLTLS